MGNTRHRVDDKRHGQVGTYETYPPFPSFNIQSRANVGELVVCDDTVCGYREKRVPHPFLCVRTKSNLPTFSGVYPPTGNPSKRLTNCPTDYSAIPSVRAKFGDLSTIDQSNLAWESLGATNPNVAHVSLPAYWAELKDLPSLWRTWGSKAVARSGELFDDLLRSSDRNDQQFLKLLSGLNPAKASALQRATVNRFVRKMVSLAGRTSASHADDVSGNATAFAPKAFIWYRWGWNPLVNDIRAMFNFTEAVQRRLVWLSNLQSGKRVLKRRATLRNSSDYDSPTTVQIKSNGAFIQARRTCIYTEKVWCTVQWKLTTDTNIAGVGLFMDPLWIKAHQLTYGITSHDALGALWQIMPWSWFVDWFLKISTIIDATNNTIPVTWGDICLMRHTYAEAVCSPLSSSSDLSWCKPSGEHRESEDRKQRLVVSPILPFVLPTMPVFTASQWSILGSLAVLKLATR